MSVEYITHCCKNLVRLNERTNRIDRADCIRVNSQNKRIRLRKIQSSLICEPAPGSNSRTDKGPTLLNIVTVGLGLGLPYQVVIGNSHSGAFFWDSSG